MTEESRKVLHTQWKITLPEEKESLSCATRRKLEDIKLNMSDTETFNYYTIPFVYGILKGQRREVTKIAE